MFIDLPMNDGIRRLEDIKYIDHGVINDDSELSSDLDPEVSEYHYYIIINMVKECHCDSYEYLFKDIAEYKDIMNPLLEGLGINQFGA